MDNLDLNIENYELQDILNLFSISNDFTKYELKQCKKQVLMTHPDKSKLSKDYFLFFSSAYKILYQIFLFKQHNDIDDTIEYDTIIDQFIKDNTNKNKNIITFAKSKEFNTEFNKLFEKNNVKNDHDNKGYGDFLSSEIEDDLIQKLYSGVISPNDRLVHLEDIRKKNNALIVHQGVQNANDFNHHTNIDDSAPSLYSSELFSSLPYEDLKKAHTETLISVTSEDARKEQFSNINDIKQHRDSDLVKPLSIQQANRFLAEKSNLESSESTNRAYRLVRQNEIVLNMQKNVDSHFNRITY